MALKKRMRTTTARNIDMFGHPLLLAALTGFLSGFIVSIPVGPINVTIINEGARRGLLWASLIGFGASAMEVIYCALAFTGFASFFNGIVLKAAMELVSFIFILYLAIRFLKTKEVSGCTSVGEKLGERLNPHSAFGVGFVRVMLNPGVFLCWVVLGASFKARDWVGHSFSDVFWCVAGVGAGTSAWFTGLSYAVSRGHGKFTEKTLLRMEHGSGLVMLGLAVAEGVHIVVQMVQHKMQLGPKP
jgi:threonine/homoserine/homoserine lactone efflux protein